MNNELIVELVTGGDVIAEVVSEGPQGPQGLSITVVSETTDANGNTVVTFSDESQITISKGDKGDAITVSTTTKDANGNTVITFSDGSQITVDKGDKGNVGDVWKPTVTTGGDLSWTKDSGATAPTQRNIKGPQGDTGDVWKPTVTAEGDLSWAKDSGATAPTQRNIKGPKGDPGSSGYTAGTNIQISGGNVISATDTTYTAGDNINIDANNEISATDTNTTYTAGTNIQISEANVISATDTVYDDTALSTAVASKLPKSGGTLDDYVEKLVPVSAGSGAINLNDGNTFTHTPSANVTYAISNAKAGVHSFTLIITMGGTLRTLAFPASVKWQGGEIPDMSTVNKTYVLTFLTINSGTTWLGMFGGEF